MSLFDAKNVGKLVGLYSYTMQSGKGTVAAALEKTHGFKVVKMAGGLKAMLAAMFVYMEEQDNVGAYLEGDLKERKHPILGVTPRHLMQTLGTEWGRDCVGEDTWVAVTSSRVENLLRKGINVVIDDIRFPNEYDMVENLGGKMWKVERLVTMNGILADAIGHSSEGGLEQRIFDVIIQNNGTLAQLELEVADHVKTLNHQT